MDSSPTPAAAAAAHVAESQPQPSQSQPLPLRSLPPHLDTDTDSAHVHSLVLPITLDASAAPASSSASSAAAAAADAAFSVPTTPVSPLRNLFRISANAGGSEGASGGGSGGGATHAHHHLNSPPPPLPAQLYPLHVHSPGLAHSPPISPEGIAPELFAMLQRQQQQQQQRSEIAQGQNASSRGSLVHHQRGQSQVPAAASPHSLPSPAAATSAQSSSGGPARGSIKARLARATTMSPGAFFAAAAAAAGVGAASTAAAAAAPSTTPSNGGRLRSPTMDSGSIASHSPTFSSRSSSGAGTGAPFAAAPHSLLSERRPSQLHLLSPTTASGLATARGHTRRPSNVHRRAPSLVLFTPSTQQQQQQPRPSSLLRRSSLGPLGVQQMQAAVAAAAANASGSAAATPLGGLSGRSGFSGFMQPPMSMMRRQSFSSLNVPAATGSAASSPSAAGMLAAQQTAAAQAQQQSSQAQAQAAAAAAAQSFFALNPNFNPAFALPTWARAGADGLTEGSGAALPGEADDMGYGDVDTEVDEAAVRDVLESGAVVDLGPSSGVGGGVGALDAAMVARLRAEEAVRARALERIFTLIFLLVLFSSLDGGALPACLLSLRADVAGMSFTRLGLLGSLNFLGLVVGGFVSGPALERWDQPLVVCAGMALQALMLFLVGAVPRPGLMLLCRFLTGLAQAPLVVFAPVWVAAHAQRAALVAPPPVHIATVPTAAAGGAPPTQPPKRQHELEEQQPPSAAALASSWTTLLHVATPIAIALGFLVGVVCSVQDERASSGLGPSSALAEGSDSDSTGPGSDRPWKWAFISQAFCILPLALLFAALPRRLTSTKDADTRSSVPSAASAAAMLYARAAALREYEAALRDEQLRQQQLQPHSFSAGPDSASAASNPFPPLRAPPRLVVSPSPQSAQGAGAGAGAATPFPASSTGAAAAALLRSAPVSVSTASTPGSSAPFALASAGGGGSAGGRVRVRRPSGPLEAVYSAAGMLGSSPPASLSAMSGGASTGPGSGASSGARKGYWTTRDASDGSVALAPTSSSAFVSGSAFSSPSGSFFRSDGSAATGGIEIAHSPFGGGPLLSLGLGLGLGAGGDADWRALDEAVQSDALERDALCAAEQPPPLWDSMDFASMFSPRHRVVTWAWSPTGRVAAAASSAVAGAGGAGAGAGVVGPSGALWPVQQHLGVDEPSSVRMALVRVMGVVRALLPPLQRLLRTPLYVAMVASLCALYFLLAGFHYWLTAFLVSTYTPQLHLGTAGLLYALVALVATPLGVVGGHAAMRVLEKRIDARFEQRRIVRAQIAELDRRAAMGVGADANAADEHGSGAVDEAEDDQSAFDSEGRRARLLSKYIFAVILALALVLALLCLLLALAPVWPAAARTAHPALAFLLVFMLLLTGGALVPCCQWILEGAMWGAAGAAGAAAAASVQAGMGAGAAAAAATAAGEEMIALAHACAQLLYNLLGYFLAPLAVGALMDHTSTAGPRLTGDLAHGFALDLGWSAVVGACLCVAGALQWRQCAHEKLLEEIARAVRMTTVDEGDEEAAEEVALHARAAATLHSATPYSAAAHMGHARSQSSVGPGTRPFASPARGHGALGHAAGPSRSGAALHHHSLPLPHSAGRSSAPSATASLPPSGSGTPTTVAVDDLNNSGSAFRHGLGLGLGHGLGLPVWSRSGSVVAFDTAAVDDSALLLHSQGRGGPAGGGAVSGGGGGGRSMRRSASAASLGLSAGFFVPARPPGFEELGSAHAHAAPFAPMRLVAHQRTPSLYRQDSEDSHDHESPEGAAVGVHDDPTSEAEDDDQDDDDYMLYGRAMQDD